LQRVQFLEALDLSDHPQSNPMQAVARKDNGQAADHEKGPGAIETWRQVEPENGSGLVPDSMVITAGDAESVIARTKVGVIGNSPRAGFNPLLVTTVEAIPELDFFRRHHAVGGTIGF